MRILRTAPGLEAYSVMQFYDHLHRPDLVEEALKGDPESKYKSAARKLNLETDAVRLERFALFGISQGATFAAAYAVKTRVALLSAGGHATLTSGIDHSGCP